MIGFDEIDQAGLEHRLHGFLEHRAKIILVVLPVIEFRLDHHVARVLERRHPFAVDLAGIPADMIDMPRWVRITVLMESGSWPSFFRLSMKGRCM